LFEWYDKCRLRRQHIDSTKRGRNWQLPEWWPGRHIGSQYIGRHKWLLDDERQRGHRWRRPATG
jgi:hypothetical protein